MLGVLELEGAQQYAGCHEGQGQRVVAVEEPRLLQTDLMTVRHHGVLLAQHCVQAWSRLSEANASTTDREGRLKEEGDHRS